jgi:hypothetical protein
MENKEGTVIGLGCIAIGCLCYFFRQYSRDTMYYKQKFDDFAIVNKEAKDNNYYIDYEGIKQSGKKVPVFVTKTDFTLK